MDQIPPPPPVVPPSAPEPVPPYEPIGAITGVITQPVPTMRSIAAARPWLIGLGIVIVASILSGMTNLTTPLPDLSEFGDVPPEGQRIIEQVYTAMRMPALWLVLGLVVGPIFFIIWSGITWLFGRLFGGRGPFSSLLATQGHAYVPAILLAILTLLLNLGGPALASITGLIGFLVAIWQIVLQVIGVRESMNMTTGRAVAAVLVPIGVLIVLLCLLICVVIAIVASAANNARQ